MIGRSWIVCALVVLSPGACAFDAGDPPPSGANAPAAGTTDTPTAAASPSPSTGDPFAFAVIGDFGSGSVAQHMVAETMCEHRDRRPFDVVVTTGDNIYPIGAVDRFRAAFFAPYKCLFDEGVRFHAVLGNHDVMTDNGAAELAEPRFGMRARNYVIRTHGVRLVMADSNLLDRDWLRRALISQPGDVWKVVVFHHPVFSSGHHGPTPGMRPGLPRMFERRGVDLVLNGHDHNYEVTVPVRGVRYVVTGGGGAPVRPCGPERWFTELCIARHHFLYVRTDGVALRVTAVGTGGDVVDHVTIPAG